MQVLDVISGFRVDLEAKGAMENGLDPQGGIRFLVLGVSYSQSLNCKLKFHFQVHFSTIIV